MTKEDQWIFALEEADAAMGGISVLINNAGISRGGNIEQLSFEDWKLVMGVNVDSVLLSNLTSHFSCDNCFDRGGIFGQSTRFSSGVNDIVKKKNAGLIACNRNEISFIVAHHNTDSV